MIPELVAAAVRATGTVAARTACAPVEQPDPGFWSDIDAGNLLGALATVIVGIVAAVVAVNAYKTQQREARRQEKAKFYAEAVRAVEDYMEAPYRILRKDGSAEARREITQHISDVKSRISFYTGWMEIHGTTAVCSAYRDFVAASQREAGPQMTAAWSAKPVKKDKDVPLRTAPLPRTATDAARDTLVTAMHDDLNR
ncbi:hypothetical protein JKP75_13315 [Blastococcus sp. TML/M2B]|uniref:hypothetical protein n=1 Tax=Blastococcus sp. TML/M2B TaxID=2798727 RepID=UPI00190D7858|nr:hypothetical protein [Blastococcus sp. TML/M2B]MBN1093457.1 hypothetical protein [Blastococcus sp. TML/M2B]